MGYYAIQAYLRGLSPLGVQLGTERVAEVLRRLGDPQRRFAALHIAGTNGKGSTAAGTAALLIAALPEARVGLYTSPHLLRLTERWQVSEGGRLVECPQDEFAACIDAVQAAAAGAPAQALTFFEVLTAGAFVWFARRGVGIAVVETGLGGRLDATRLCEPLATAVTSIGLDHTELLGDTLPQIAREKAGIFRPGVPAAVACDDAAALAALVDEAARVGAPLSVLDTGLSVPAGVAVGPVPAGVGRVPPLSALAARSVALCGAHQQRNAALAVFLARQVPGVSERLDDEAVLCAGLAAARWPGRLELLLTDRRGVSVWADAAHNPEGAEALDRWLHEARAGRWLGVVFGVVSGKQVAGMLGPVRGADLVAVTRPPSVRGRPAEEVLALLPGAARLCPEPAAALREVCAAARPGGMVLVYGSIFLVAEARRLLLHEPADPEMLQDPVRVCPP